MSPEERELRVAASRLRIEGEWNRIIALEALGALAQLLSKAEAQDLEERIRSKMAVLDQALQDLPDDAERLARAARLSADVRAALRLAGPSHE